MQTDTADQLPPLLTEAPRSNRPQVLSPDTGTVPPPQAIENGADMLLDHWKERVAVASTRQDEAERRASEALRLTEAERQKAAALREAVEGALRQLQTLQDEQIGFQSALDEASARTAKDLLALQVRLDAAEAEKRELAAKLEESVPVRLRVVALQDALAKVEVEVFSKRNELADLQIRQSRSRQKTAELEDELEAARSDALSASSTIEAHTHRALHLTTQNSGLAVNLEAQRRRADQAEESLARLSAQLDKAVRDLAVARQSASQAQTRIAELAVVETHNASLLARDGEYQRRAIENERARQAFERQLDEARRAAAERERTLWLRDLQLRAWQDSRFGRVGLSLLRARRKMSALKTVVLRTKPNPLFDTVYYYACNPDVAMSGEDAYSHYLRHGAREGRNPNAMFDSAWYLRNNPDVAARGTNPLWHYFADGAAELRDPHPNFSTRRYLEQNPQAITSGLNPLEHFLRSKGLLATGPA